NRSGPLIRGFCRGLYWSASATKLSNVKNRGKTADTTSPLSPRGRGVGGKGAWLPVRRNQSWTIARFRRPVGTTHANFSGRCLITAKTRVTSGGKLSAACKTPAIREQIRLSIEAKEKSWIPS